MAIILASCVDETLFTMALATADASASYDPVKMMPFIALGSGDVLPRYVALKLLLAAASAASRDEFFQFLALRGPCNDTRHDFGNFSRLSAVTG